MASATIAIRLTMLAIVVTLVGGATMKLRLAVLVSCVLFLATAALPQLQTGPATNRPSPVNTGCPSLPVREIAWFDTCSYLPIGNGVRPGRAITTPAAEYAESARRAKITGQVVLAVAINATGVVDRVRVVKPLEPGLDQNAVEAINKWRFTPATKDGKPVAVQMKVEVGYSLH
jgi:TonB family protein